MRSTKSTVGRTQTLDPHSLALRAEELLEFASDQVWKKRKPSLEDDWVQEMISLAAQVNQALRQSPEQRALLAPAEQELLLFLAHQVHTGEDIRVLVRERIA